MELYVLGKVLKTTQGYSQMLGRAVTKTEYTKVPRMTEKEG
jgi:hypothetical protein